MEIWTDLVISDMIEGNESHVANIDYELLAERGDKFLCFALFQNAREVSISLILDLWLPLIWDQNVVFLIE